MRLRCRVVSDNFIRPIYLDERKKKNEKGAKTKGGGGEKKGSDQVFASPFMF